MAWIVTAIIVGTAAVGYGASEKNVAEKSAKGAAEQQKRDAVAERERLEEKYGLTQGELEREQRLFGLAPGDEGITLSGGLEQQTQAEKERRAGMTGEELLKEAGPETEQLYNLLGKRLGISGEELFRREGPTAGALSDQILAGAKDPGATFESTLSGELELARQMVNQEANRRGVFGGQPEGGIRFEQLGRSAIDLAVKSANARQAQRQQDLANAQALVSNYVSMSEKSRAESATMGTAALTVKERARAELDTFLANMQNLQATAKGREANVGLTASGMAVNTTNLANQELQSMYGLKAAQGGELMKSGVNLAAVGMTGGIDATKGLPTTETLTPGSGKISLSDLIKQPGYNTETNLSDLSGSSMLDWKKPKANLIYS